MKLLISAFMPFANNEVNYSLEVLNKLIEHQDIVKVVLPVLYKDSFAILEKVIEEQKPDLIILLGEARSYPSVGFEVIAVNEFGRHADSAGLVPASRFIIEGGPDGIFMTLNFELFTAAFNETNTMFHRSYSAGTYVCNTLIYKTLYYLESYNLKVQCGFIHIPDREKQGTSSVVIGLNNYLTKLLD